MKKGFTVIEVIVAIFLITAGIVGVLSLITQTISSVSISRDKLIAAYLAQEGIEIVRNIRDGNWLEQRNNLTLPWDDGIAPCLPANRPCSAEFEADYDDQNLSSYTGNPLNLENPPSNMYGYGSGTPTKFRRKITITAPAETYILQVSVLVEWEEKGKPYSVEAQENLYNWHEL